jgi:hypothetical protein
MRIRIHIFTLKRILIRIFSFKILHLIEQINAKRAEQNYLTFFLFTQVPGELGGSGLDASGTPGQSAERSPGPPPVPALPAPPTPPDNPQNEEERRQVTFISCIGLKGKFNFRFFVKTS